MILSLKRQVENYEFGGDCGNYVLTAIKNNYIKNTETVMESLEFVVGFYDFFFFVHFSANKWDTIR